MPALWFSLYCFPFVFEIEVSDHHVYQCQGVIWEPHRRAKQEAPMLFPKVYPVNIQTKMRPKNKYVHVHTRKTLKIPIQWQIWLLERTKNLTFRLTKQYKLRGSCKQRNWIGPKDCLNFNNPRRRCVFAGLCVIVEYLRRSLEFRPRRHSPASVSVRFSEPSDWMCGFKIRTPPHKETLDCSFPKADENKNYYILVDYFSIPHKENIDKGAIQKTNKRKFHKNLYWSQIHYAWFNLRSSPLSNVSFLQVNNIFF